MSNIRMNPSDLPYEVVDFPYFPFTDESQQTEIPISLSAESEERLLNKDAIALMRRLSPEGIGLPQLMTYDKDQIDLGVTIEIIASLQSKEYTDLIEHYKRMQSLSDDDLLTEFSQYFYRNEKGEIQSPFFKKVGGTWEVYCVQSKPRGISGSGQVHGDFDILYKKFHPDTCHFVLSQHSEKKPAKVMIDPPQSTNEIFISYDEGKKGKDATLVCQVWDAANQKWLTQTIKVEANKKLPYKKLEAGLYANIQSFVERLSPEMQAQIHYKKIETFGGGSRLVPIDQNDPQSLFIIDDQTSSVKSGQKNPTRVVFKKPSSRTHSEFLLINRYFSNFAEQGSLIDRDCDVGTLTYIFPKNIENKNDWWLTRSLPSVVGLPFIKTMLKAFARHNLIDANVIDTYIEGRIETLEDIQHSAEVLCNEPLEVLPAGVDPNLVSTRDMYETNTMDCALAYWEETFKSDPSARFEALLDTLFIAVGLPLDDYNPIRTLRSHPINDILFYLRKNAAEILGLTPPLSSIDENRVNGKVAHALNTYEFGMDKNSILTQAAMFGNNNIIQTLISAGANIESKNSRKETPLILVANLLTHPVCYIINEAHTGIRAEDIYKDAIRITTSNDKITVYWNTPTECKSKEIDREIFEKIFEYDVDQMKPEPPQNGQPISDSEPREGVVDLKRLAQFCEIDLSDNIKKIETLIANKANPSCVNKFGETALSLIVRNFHPQASGIAMQLFSYQAEYEAVMMQSNPDDILIYKKKVDIYTKLIKNYNKLNPIIVKTLQDNILELGAKINKSQQEVYNDLNVEIPAHPLLTSKGLFARPASNDAVINVSDQRTSSLKPGGTGHI